MSFVHLLTLLGVLPSFFIALLPGECQSYLDDTGRVMTACTTDAQAPNCEVLFFAGPMDPWWMDYDGRYTLKQGAQTDEAWDLPAMRCTTVNGLPMVEMWSTSKPAVEWVYLPAVVMP